MYHLRPEIRHPPGTRVARVWIMDGSEPPPGCGSVMAKAERTAPETIGASQRSFWAGVATFSSTIMLPSSGAAELNHDGAEDPSGSSPR